MHIAIARFPAVPAGDKDFRGWLAWSNDQLRETAGLKARRLLGASDGCYTALVEHESASTLATMRAAEPISVVQERLGQIVGCSDTPNVTA